MSGRPRVERDGFEIEAGANTIRYAGRELRVGPVRSTFLHALAASSGPVSAARLHARCTHSLCENSIGVLVSKLRKRLAKAGVPVPIVNVRGKGYQWEIAA